MNFLSPVLKKYLKSRVYDPHKSISGTLKSRIFIGKTLSRLGMKNRNHEIPKKKCLLANVGSKNTVSWGIVHAKPKIGPLLGRSFEKWFAV